MRKFVSEHRTSLAIGVLVFILIASILSVGIMAGQDKRDKEDYEKIENALKEAISKTKCTVYEEQ